MADFNLKVVQQAADKLRDLFTSKFRLMAEAWDNCDEKLSVSLKVAFSPASDNHALTADIGISFKIDEYKQKTTFTFADGFGPLFDKEAMTGPRRILFKDFGDLRNALEDAARERRLKERADALAKEEETAKAEERDEAQTDGEAQEEAEIPQAQGEAQAGAVDNGGKDEDGVPDGKSSNGATDLKRYAPQGLWDKFTRVLMKMGLNTDSIVRDCHSFVYVDAENRGLSVRDVLEASIEKPEMFLKAFNQNNRIKEGIEGEAPCIRCEYHKGMVNKQKGIRVPGVPGKCIRNGGHCFMFKEWSAAQEKKVADPKSAGKKPETGKGQESSKTGLNYVAT